MRDLSGKSLLLVDDDKYNIYAMVVLLEDLGLNIVTAGNGYEAIEKLRENPGFAIVLMDIMMPEMDGYEAMRIIRTDARFQKLPILALTAKAMKGDFEKCLEAGATDYLSKPIDIEKIMMMIDKYIGE